MRDGTEAVQVIGEADQGIRRPFGQNAWGLLDHQASSWKAGVDRE
jgi:hypothetical protein